jgi:hypothetical protein
MTGDAAYAAGDSRTVVLPEVAQQLIQVGLQKFAEDTVCNSMLEHDSFAGRLIRDISLSFR